MYFLAHLTDFDEVVANHAFNFASVNQEEELRLDSGVKEEFKFLVCVGVDADVVVLCVLLYQVFVVSLNLGTHRVPTGGEVE